MEVEVVCLKVVCVEHVSYGIQDFIGREAEKKHLKKSHDI
jgi:hypothetical protein